MPKPKIYTKQMLITLTPEQYEQVQKEAESVGVPPAVYARMAVIEKLKQDKNE